ncbi:alkaline phosphatase family protein [Fodinicola acaciae]|uniref:alkaline phosphatase family protein n=1 Tax=Fodinicola acaciae TaxID=2681555 RepID=UPI001C9E917D|nr:alkaline phosphatase family protein [Fodinicola acaciae]
MRVPHLTVLRAAAVTAVTVVAAAGMIAATGLAGGASKPVAQVLAAVHRYDHVVIVMHENKNYPDIASGSKAPYLKSLASQGALFTQSFGITHPSQPNYIALFSGSTQGVTGDTCPNTFRGKGNLFQQLGAASLSYRGYSEDLPSAGYTGCSSSDYRRKHAPWVNFDNVTQSMHVPFSSFPSDYTKLPTLSFVIPNMCNDMHDCSIGTGDTWQKTHLDAYAQWAKTHNSLLITTFDEDNFTSVNQIYTSFVGSNIKVGSYSEQVDHYRILRTIEDMYGLPALGNAASRTAITDVFN